MFVDNLSPSFRLHAQAMPALLGCPWPKCHHASIMRRACILWIPFARAWLLPGHLARHLARQLAHPYLDSCFSNWHASAMVQPCSKHLHQQWDLNASQCFDMICVLLSYYFQLLYMLMFSDSKATFLQLTKEGHRGSNKLHLLMFD